MNLPNRLTVLRIILVPFFLVALTVSFPHNYLAALIIFCVASITDYFDGQIARKRNLITNFGKFLDPLADKMLTTSALIAFVAWGDKVVFGGLWICFITLLREFIVAGIRLSAVADGGKVVAANMWGKVKTVMQMVATIIIIFVEWLGQAGFIEGNVLNICRYTGSALLWIATLFMIISGVIYVKDNADYIKE